jgi:alpha-ribazole phosphatase
VALYLIRHPEPPGARGLCYGRQDLPCDPGMSAIAAAAIRAQLPAHALRSSPVFTSPLSRCRMLAEQLAAPDLPRIADPLIELDFGAWEGTRWDALPRAELDAWAHDVWHYRPGGGESAAMVEERWTRWYHEVAPLGCDSVLAVTHAGVIRTALASSGQLRREDAASAAIAFGSVHRIEPPARRLQPRGKLPCTAI